jgi:lysophospholipase L1-like esterase
MHRFAVLVVLLLAATISAADGPRPTIPVEKNPERHQQFLEIAKAGNIDLLFLGDSITDGWRSTGKAVWEQYFAPLKAANFGISADRTEHVIWRLRNGELDGIHPKLVVLMIGTNNGADPVEDVALGIKTIIGDIQQRSPGTRILLLGIFPRNELPGGGRQKNEAVNKIIAGYANPNDPKKVVYLDIGDRFLSPDKVLSKDIMPDSLHPNAKGYQIWAEAIINPVKQLLQEDPGHLAPSFAKPADDAKVAKIEASIATGNVAAGIRALERLTTDRDADTAASAKSSLAAVEAWKTSIDAELARLRGEGDIYLAAEMAAAMSKLYTGEPGKTYRDLSTELRRDPGYATGKELQKLADMPFEARKDPRFAKLIDGFLKKHPDGYYAEQAKALLPK